MKSKFLLLFAATMVAGCDQQQSKMLALRAELEKQIQAKDKTIADLTHTNIELQQQLLKPAQAGPNSDKIADAVSEKVSKSIEQQTASLAEIKGQVEEILKSMKNASSTALAPATSDPRGAGTHQAPQATQEMKDPTRKKYKFDF